MKRLVLIAATALTLAALPAQAQQAVGVASAVQNDVRLRKPGGPIPRPVALRQRIALADQIQTGAKSQLQMLLLDKSIFTVGPNARVTIDRYVYDPNRNSRSMGVSVGRGAFRFMSGSRTSGGGSSINTPVAAIGVRGTIVEGVVGENAVLIGLNEPAIARVRGDRETASLIVLRGPGRGTQGNVAPGAIDVTAGGRTVTADRPMQAIYVPYAGAAPIGPFVISNSGLSQLQSVLFPALAERLGLQQPIDPDHIDAPGDYGRSGDYTQSDRDQPRLPRRPFPGSDLNGPPPGYNPGQQPYGSAPNLPGAGPRPDRPAPQQQAPQNQKQSPAAVAPDPAPAGNPAAPNNAAPPNNGSPPKDPLAPPNLKAAPALAAPAQLPPNQDPNDPKAKGKPADPPQPGPQ